MAHFICSSWHPDRWSLSARQRLWSLVLSALSGVPLAAQPLSDVGTAQPLYANEKEQIYLDQGFVMFPPRKSRNLDPAFIKQQEAERAFQATMDRMQGALNEAVAARMQAQQRITELEQQRMQYEVQAALSLQEERQLRQAAQANAAQAAAEKDKAEKDFGLRLERERLARAKIQQELQAMLDQREKLVQSHVQQLRQEELKRQDLVLQMKRLSSEESDSEARLAARLVSEEQARLELQAQVRRLETERTRLQQELDKIRAERRSTILISPSPKP